MQGASGSVSYPHDVDVDPDPDPTLHFNADPDTDRDPAPHQHNDFLRPLVCCSKVKTERTNVLESFWKQNQNVLVSFPNLSC
jgi:hypothetical protein